MANEGFQIDRRFKKKMVGRFEKYRLESGILKDKPHREPKSVKQAKAELASSRKPPRSKTNQKPKSGPKKPKSQSITKKFKKKIAKALQTKKSKKKMRHDAMVKRNRARGLGTMEGGPVRLKKASTRGMVSEIANYMRKKHGIPYLTQPFRNDKSKEMKALKRELLNLITRKSKSYSKVQTALRAVIRNPFLKRQYGRNSRSAIRNKTFDRLGIDTGQVFQALDGKVRVNPNVQK